MSARVSVFQRLATALSVLCALSVPAMAEQPRVDGLSGLVAAARPAAPRTTNATSTPAKPDPRYQWWMSLEVADAWQAGYLGQGTMITMVDDYISNRFLQGNLGYGTRSLRHGEWTWFETQMVAPAASAQVIEFTDPRPVMLNRWALNAVNLSYAMYARAGFNPFQLGWTQRDASLIAYAHLGAAVISKAAGNDTTAVGAPNRSGNVDYLDLALVGAPSAIFVGALDRNGTPEDKANLASYSNFAGPNPVVQRQYVAVGVRSDLLGLYGTSFAAPVITGYAALLGSKFPGASPVQITNRLLDTARSDTIANFTPLLHGRGEASITRALAPTAIR